jgi:hypothetical protein
MIAARNPADGGASLINAHASLSGWCGEKLRE